VARLYDLFGLENSPRSQSRRWIRFQLIGFSVFTFLESVLFLLAIIDRDAKETLLFGSATVMFGSLLGVSIHQWRKYGHSNRA
jgi:hypothetical protein